MRLEIDAQILWVPAHVGVQGNETVHPLAKNGLKANQVELAILISKAETKVFIWNKICNGGGYGIKILEEGIYIRSSKKVTGEK